MLKKITFYLILSSLFASYSRASNTDLQFKMDSLIEVFQSDSILPSDFERNEQLIDDILFYAEKLKNIPILFEYNAYFAHMFRDFPPEKSEKQVEKLDFIMDCCSDEISGQDIITYYLIKAYISSIKGNYSTQLNYLLFADSICIATNDTTMNRYVDKKILGYYFYIKDYEKGLKVAYNTEKKYFVPEDSLSFSYLMSVGDIAGLHYYLENYDSSVFYFKKVIKNGIANFHDLHFEYFAIGRAYSALNELDSAYYYFNLSKEEAGDKYAYSTDIIILNIELSKLYNKRKQYNKALIESAKAIVYSDSLGYLMGQKSANEQHLKNSLQKANSQDLLGYFNAFIKANDSIYNRESKDREKRYLTQYETLKKEVKIQELEAEKVEKERKYAYEKQTNAKNKLILIIGLIGSVLFSLLLISRFKRKQVILKQKISIKEFEKTKVADQLQFKEKDLNHKIELLKENNKVIQQLKQELSSSETKSERLDQIILSLDQNYISDKQWGDIALQFNIIHPKFIAEIKTNSETLTQNDIRMAILLKLGYNNNSISEILNISYEGVRKAKQRLKKKMNGIAINELDANQSKKT